jgi:hypothetical protein
MTPRQGKKFRTSDQVGDLAVRQRHAAGIDVPAAIHFVAVPVADVRPRRYRNGRRPGVGTGTAPGSTRGRCCIGRVGWT